MASAILLNVSPSYLLASAAPISSCSNPVFTLSSTLSSSSSSSSSELLEKRQSSCSALKNINFISQYRVSLLNFVNFIYLIYDIPGGQSLPSLQILIVTRTPHTASGAGVATTSHIVNNRI